MPGRGYIRRGLRAQKGSVPSTVVLRLAGEDLELVRAAAKRRRSSVQAWLRGAVLAKLISERVP